ncbi:sensor histidine kinase [Nocardioides piscis]|uniref:histidine kinase n=1 Tax=Nocardioides piscis TaxID=2714938 RepID=A0A6G7YCR6_9ACTN|nr:HAMP domain-containing sensor histidine kinase [Nocardioides piscis]QIK74595.1 HAMP domain-containing histidine kinase [Nocardioides piscis]
MADVVQGVYSVAEDNRVAGDLEVTRRLAVAALKAKSDFVARMSHEMRSPLTSILATAELLAETSSDADQELVTTLQRSSQRLLSMIDDVLDFTAIGDHTMPLKEFDLLQVIRNVVAQLEPDAQAKGLSLRVHIDDDVPQRVRGHPKWTAQILLEVLGNAVKYTDAGQVELTVTTTTSANADTNLLYRISDTGMGIDPASRNLVFESFTAGTGTSEEAGRAAGLSIVKQLVTISGGGIALDSAPGRGTTFWITMPAEVVAPPEPSG